MPAPAVGAAVVGVGEESAGVAELSVGRLLGEDAGSEAGDAVAVAADWPSGDVPSSVELSGTGGRTSSDAALALDGLS